MRIVNLAVLGSIAGGVVHALPVDIVNESNAIADPLAIRAGTNDGSSIANAIDITINCGPCPTCCDADAFAILCVGAPDTLQREVGRGPNSANRRASGASFGPFRLSAAQAAQAGVTLPSPLNGVTYNSPEEYPFANSREGGFGAVLMPVPYGQQPAQGGQIGAAFRQFNVNDGDFYRITAFTNCGGRPYCDAFNADPKDWDICKRKQNLGQSLIDVGRLAIRRSSGFNQPVRFQQVGTQKLY